MKKAVTMSIISIVGIVAIYLMTCKEIYSSQVDTNEDTIWGMVSDKQTHQPISNAIVYYGGIGFVRIRTDQAGHYHLKIPRGEVYLCTFAKGYRRLEQRLTIAQDEIREVNFELEQKDTLIDQVTLTGTLENRIVHAGSRSEVQYLELLPVNRESIVIFDDIGMNDIRMDAVAARFGEFIGKRVTITGFYEIGYIGWQRGETNGVYVEDITRVQ